MVADQQRFGIFVLIFFVLTIVWLSELTGPALACQMHVKFDCLYSVLHNWSEIWILALSQTPTSIGRDSPEQRSFRDRQKYFEIDVKQQTPDKPKPRISLVGEDDLKKMKEEEGLCLFDVDVKLQ